MSTYTTCKVSGAAVKKVAEARKAGLDLTFLAFKARSPSGDVVFCVTEHEGMPYGITPEGRVVAMRTQAQEDTRQASIEDEERAAWEEYADEFCCYGRQ